MQKFKEFPSLKPYLTPTPGSCFLQISLISANEPILEKSSFPFIEVTQSDPLHRLLKGQFISGAYSEIQKVFLLIQRDNYLFKRDELSPLTNLTIEQSWQRALHKHWQAKSSIFLANPIGEKNEIIGPWAPLLFCKKQKAFFPNLCPRCGKDLELCREDDLLAEYKLAAYSSSLERYLYCPSCFKEGEKEFFTYTSDQGDPPYVKDRFALLGALVNLFSLEINENLFPCCVCPEQLECFGGRNLGPTRLTFFSFYPFYMLIFKAQCLNAQDFIILLGGAQEGELQEELKLKREIGRAESLKPFFQDRTQQANHIFIGQDNFFGEVLLLKLAFLCGVMQKLWGKNNFFGEAELRYSLERIWVDLPSANKLLPTFWNFQVEIIDLPNSFPLGSFSNLLATESFYFLGQLWFYTLLANKKQKVYQVYSALEKVKEVIPTAETFSFADFSPVFKPKNIFWNPEGHQVPAHFVTLWEEALRLGWSLLRWSWQEKSVFSPEKFLAELVDLKEKVKDHLFQVKMAQARSVPFEEDGALSRILKNILAEWVRVEGVSGAEATETVILTPGKEKQEIPSPASVLEPAETVIITKEEYKASRPPAAPDLTEEVIQTVILRPEPKKQEKPSAPSGRGESEEAVETVIIKPQVSPAEDLGAETVIISPPAKHRGAQQKPPAEKLPKEETEETVTSMRAEKEEIEADLLSETVIIQPKRTSEKGKYGGKK